VAEPIISTGAALVGASTWFAAKIFGPSADSLGESLRAYLGDRISKVFARAEEITHSPDDLKELPPGYLFKLVQSVSFSEDDDGITDLWANLLVSSAEKFDQRHVMYMDILDKLCADDAVILNNLVRQGVTIDSYQSKQWTVSRIRDHFYSVANSVLESEKISHFDTCAFIEFDKKVKNFELAWPTVILETIVPVDMNVIPEDKREPDTFYPTVATRGLSRSEASYDALIRQRLIQSFSLSFMAGFQITVAGVMATPLAIDFLSVCRRAK
jgi:hypothetical protein